MAATARGCSGDMAVSIRKVLARPWVGVRLCHLLLLFEHYTAHKVTRKAIFNFNEIVFARLRVLPTC